VKKSLAAFAELEAKLFMSFAKEITAFPVVSNNFVAV
jgi:hypothetical protein